MRSLAVGPTLALVVLSSSPAGRPGPTLRARVPEQPTGGAGDHTSRDVEMEIACCGYPLVRDKGFALRFYWLAMEDRFQLDDERVVIYGRDGFFIGTYPEPFVKSLLMEGSGVLADGRLINYSGRCAFGVGTCYEPLDEEEYPFGRGAGRRALVPFKSVAVDPRVVAIGEPLFVPEFDGIVLPDGTRHDGCVRADDTGGNIKRREMDFFVVSQENYRLLAPAFSGILRVTPHIEHPRCTYMRQE